MNRNPLAGLREWLSRLRGTAHPNRSDTDLERELAHHLELAEEALRRQGRSLEEAARLARIQAGGQTQTMEILRDRRGIPPLSTFWLDVKLGLRMLRKQWGLTLIGGLAMAASMAVGASTFDLVHVMSRTTVPLEEGDRVVVVQPFDSRMLQPRTSSREEFERWRDASLSVEDVGAFRTVQRDLITASGPKAPVDVAEMSAAGFRVARIAPLRGRFLLDEDELAGASPVVVLGYDAWQSTFAADPNVVGQQVRLAGVYHTIVGVMPEGFAFPVSHGYWTGLKTNSRDRVVVFARLAPQATLESAQAEIATMGLQDPNPENKGGGPLRARVVPYVIGISGDSMPGIVTLLPLGLPLVLVLPCANIAILIYARIVARQGEFAVRTALGASRSRIVGQIFVEVLVLAAGAAALALVVAPKLAGFLHHNLIPGRSPFWLDFGLSYPTIGYAAVLAIVAALLAGGIPALRATRRWNLAGGLHALGARSAPKLGKIWTGLVLLQVALSVAILPTGAEIAWALCGPSIAGSRFTAEEYLTARLSMDPRAASDPVRFANARDELVRQLRAEPGVAGATLAEAIPSQETYLQVQVEGTGSVETAAFNRVDLEFFDTFNTRVLTGRGFESGDVEPGRDTILVNRSFARRILGDGNPLGRRVRTVAKGSSTINEQRLPESGTGPWLEVVGVVEDFSAKGGFRTFYRPLPRIPKVAPGANNRVNLAIHAGPAILAKLPRRLRQIAASLDPDFHVEPLRTMDTVYESFWLQDLTLASGLGGLMLGVVLFSVAGVYTLMAFTVVQRRREIGIRSALGAAPSRLIGGIFRQVLLPVSFGVAIGGLAALLLDYYLSPLLFDFREGGRPLPWVLPGAEAFILLIAAIALYGPVRRALRVDPVEVLRES